MVSNPADRQWGYTFFAAATTESPSGENRRLRAALSSREIPAAKQGDAAGEALLGWSFAADLSVSRMNAKHPSFDRAIKDLGVRRTFRHGTRTIEIATLVRETDWRPLRAPWWRGKEVCVIGTDLAAISSCVIATEVFGTGSTRSRQIPC
jgi:hypothetical protein